MPLPRRHDGGAVFLCPLRYQKCAVENMKNIVKNRYSLEIAVLFIFVRLSELIIAVGKLFETLPAHLSIQVAKHFLYSIKFARDFKKKIDVTLT